MERIILTGPHSCGKTTLANALISNWREIFPMSNEPSLLGEVARTVMSSKGFTRDDVGKLDFQRAIMDAQIIRESSITKPYVSDRCIVDPMAYTLLQSAPGNSSEGGVVQSETSTRNFESLLSRSDAQRTLASYRDRRKTLVILFEPVEEFAVDDGTRMVVENMEQWMECLRAFESALEKAGITSFERLGPETIDLGERVRKVKNWVQQKSG